MGYVARRRRRPTSWCFFFFVEKGPDTDAPQPWGFLCNPVMKMMMIIFCTFPSNGAPVE
jgi:hypothetical protein